MDNRLVEQAQRGDQEAFGVLAVSLGDRLFGLAHRILRDADLASDATQRALIAVWRELPNLRDTARFDAWSYRLLVNACHTESRRSRRWTPSLRVMGMSEPLQPDGTALVIDRDQLERGFRRLSVDHRTVVALHYYRDMPLSAIAEVLGVPTGTVRSRLHYAIRTMRAALDADLRASREVAR